MEIVNIKTRWPERRGFRLYRGDTGNEYIFIHFLTDAIIEANGVRESVSAGDCILYKKHSVQLLYSPDNLLVHDWFHMTGECEGILQKFGLEFCRVYHVGSSDLITSHLQNIEYEFLHKSPYHHEICEAKVYELFGYIARSQTSESGEYIDRNMLDDFRRLREEIQSTYHEHWSAEKMAEKLHISLPVFYRKYRQIFGVTPRQDLIDTRIGHAKTMLLQENYSVEKLSQLLGYENQYHFIRQFRERTGTTPAKYSHIKKE